MADLRSLENTPSWAVAIVCSLLILISILIDHAIELLTKFSRRRKRKSLSRALKKIKAELMLLGFVSLLLTVGAAPISKFCVPRSVGSSFGACKNPKFLDSWATGSTCEKKGMVSLIPSHGIHQLHIFIFVLAAFHVLYCALTLTLGRTKISRWKAWEEETTTLDYQLSHDPHRFRLTRQTSFGRRHLKFWSKHPLLLWPVCFLRQFNGSISKVDYFTLRHGFIVTHLSEGSKFDFIDYMARALDEDFGLVVGISPWIWMVSILLIFFKARVFYSHLWLPFLPLVMVLVVGTKLQHSITRMCLESSEQSSVVRGSLLVKPHDNLFWFGRPQWLLHLMHFILFQNSFQLAFLTWSWYEFGLKSCFQEETAEFALWIAMGVLVQILSGYVILPLYALVTQMGSSMKSSVFTERVAKGLKKWHASASRRLADGKTSSTAPSPESSSIHTGRSSLSIDIKEEEEDPKNSSDEIYNGEITFRL